MVVCAREASRVYAPSRDRRSGIRLCRRQFSGGPVQYDVRAVIECVNKPWIYVYKLERDRAPGGARREEE